MGERYFAVTDATVAVERAQELGGVVEEPPRRVPAGRPEGPGGPRFAVVRDPQGARFALVEAGPGG